MAKVRIGQRAQRVLKFAMGARSGKAAAALARYGFTADDLREGVQLLAAVVDRRLEPLAPTQEPKLVRQVDEFENEWFPLVRATLARHYPEIGDRVMGNLPQSSDQGVTVTVAAFMRRLHELEDPSGPFGARGPEARTLLAQRGLTDEPVSAVASVLEQLASLEQARPDEPARALSEAEDRMWAWYLEWSRIARNAIKDRGVLRRLGFLQSAPGHASDEVEAVDGASEPVPAESSVGMIAAPQLAAGSTSPGAVPAPRLVAGE